MGTLGGFKLHVEDRQDQRRRKRSTRRAGSGRQGVPGPDARRRLLSYQINVPQLNVNVDRVKAKQPGREALRRVPDAAGVPGLALCERLQPLWPHLPVVAQADAPFRSQVDDILPLKTRNAEGRDGAARLARHRRGVLRARHRRALQRLSAPPTSTAARPPGFSSGEAQAAISKILDETLPRGMSYEWTDLAYQQMRRRATPTCSCSRCACCSCSWCWPRSTRASHCRSPSSSSCRCVCSPASRACCSQGGDNNIFTQIGFLVLVGLACKNAILIVEFAKHLQDHGRDAVSGRARSRAPAPAADPDDLHRVHHGRDAAGARHWRRCRGAPGHGCSGVLRNDRRDRVRPSAHARVLRADAQSRGRARPRRCLRCPRRRAAMRNPNHSQVHSQDLSAEERNACIAASRRASRCVGSLWLSACAVGPNYVKPEVPVTREIRQALRRQRIRSAESVGRSSGSSSATRRSTRSSPNALAVEPRPAHRARARRRSARAAAAKPRFDLAPTITASRRLHESSATRSPSERWCRRGETELYDAGFDAFWELDFFGRVRRGIEARNADLARGRSGSARCAGDRHRRSHAHVLRAARPAKPARRGPPQRRATSSSTLDLTNARLDAGRGTELDTSRAQAQLSATLGTIAPLEAAVSRSIHRLSVLTGREPTALTCCARPRRVTLPRCRASSRSAIRPTCCAAARTSASPERALAAATARIGVAVADLFPHVTFTGSVGLRGGQLRRPRRLAARVRVLIAPGISWAAFDLGRVRARIAARPRRKRRLPRPV